jgi:hypothetical protein
MRMHSLISLHPVHNPNKKYATIDPANMALQLEETPDQHELEMFPGLFARDKRGTLTIWHNYKPGEGVTITLRRGKSDTSPLVATLDLSKIQHPKIELSTTLGFSVADPLPEASKPLLFMLSWKKPK